jgi:hypothetical protein
VFDVKPNTSTCVECADDVPDDEGKDERDRADPPEPPRVQPVRRIPVAHAVEEPGDPEERRDDETDRRGEEDREPGRAGARRRRVGRMRHDHEEDADDARNLEVGELLTSLDLSRTLAKRGAETC